MKPWREIASRTGTFSKENETGRFRRRHFGVAGNASPEYQDAKSSFREHISPRLRHLLISVVRRLNRLDGDPVINCRPISAGKTHTLLAVYHLATSGMPTSELRRDPRSPRPGGNRHAPEGESRGHRRDPPFSEPAVQRRETSKSERSGENSLPVARVGRVSTPWASDRSGTAPGKRWWEILRLAAPCVILLDEAVAFFRQLNQPEPYGRKL